MQPKQTELSILPIGDAHARGRCASSGTDTGQVPRFLMTIYTRTLDRAPPKPWLNLNVVSTVFVCNSAMVFTRRSKFSTSSTSPSSRREVVLVEFDDATASSAAGFESSVGSGSLCGWVGLGDSQADFTGFGLGP